MGEIYRGVQLKKYDILTVKRDYWIKYGYIFEHRAMYVGNGKVLHFTAAAESMNWCLNYYLMKFLVGPFPASDLPGLVYFSLLNDFIGNNEWIIEDDTEEAKEKGLIRLSDQEIERNIERALNSYYPYCLFTYNCDHFVTEMKYGRGFSQQTSLQLGLLLVIAVVFVLIFEVTKNDKQSIYRDYRDKWSRIRIRLSRKRNFR